MLKFDGVFRDCTVVVNDWSVGKHESGYGSFKLDVTDVVECGSNNTVFVPQPSLRSVPLNDWR